MADMNILWNKIRKEVNTSKPKVKKDEKQKKKKLVNIHSTPTMVFSVIGNSDSFVPRPWPTTLFQTALIEAAKSGGGIVFIDRMKYKTTYGVFFLLHNILCWTLRQMNMH